MSIVLTEPVVGKVKRIVVTDEGITYLQDIAAVSDAEGWNPAFQQINSGTYICPYELFVEGDTDFRIGYIRPETLSFDIPTGTENYLYALNVTCRSFYLGRQHPTDAGDNYGGVISMVNTYKRGARIVPYETLEVHNSFFTTMHYFYIYVDGEGEGNITNTHFIDIQFGAGIGSTANVVNGFATGGYYGLSGAPKTVDGLNIGRCFIGILMTGAGATFRNVKIDYCSSGNYTYLRCGNSGTTDKVVNYIDCQIPKEGLGWYLSGGGTARNFQNLITTTEITVFDEDGAELAGATVEIYDKNGNLIFTGYTGEDGKINTELIYYRKYRDVSAGAYVGDEVIEDYTPFKLTVKGGGVLDTVLSDLSFWGSFNVSYTNNNGSITGEADGNTFFNQNGSLTLRTNGNGAEETCVVEKSYNFDSITSINFKILYNFLRYQYGEVKIFIGDTKIWDSVEVNGVNTGDWSISEWEQITYDTTGINGQQTIKFQLYTIGTATAGRQIWIDDLELVDYDERYVVIPNNHETYKLQKIDIVDGKPTYIRAQLKPKKSLIIGTNGGVMLKLNPENSGEGRDLGILLNE